LYRTNTGRILTHVDQYGNCTGTLLIILFTEIETTPFQLLKN